MSPRGYRSMRISSRQTPDQSRQAAQKGPDARRRPKVAREAYSLYVERAIEGANEAAGPFSAICVLLEAHVLVGREGRHRHEIDGVLGHAWPDAGEGAEVHERREHRPVDGDLLDAMEKGLALGGVALPRLLLEEL